MATSAPTSTGGLAADYARHGLALCAIPLGSKGPNTKGWNLPENAITDPDVAAKLTGNVGLLHAYSGTMALDVDDAMQAQEWLLARGVNPRQLLAATDHVGIISGREGRGKLVYRLPEDIGPIKTLQVKNQAGDTILEFRCADSGGNSVQDVLPPSIHPDTGQPYRWGGPGDWRSPPQIPDVLLKVWQDELAKNLKANLSLPPQPQSFSHPIDVLADTSENRAELVRLLGLTDGGQRLFDPNAGRSGWLRDLWSLAALGEWTHDAARDWSKEGRTFADQKFEQDWASFDPSRTGGITEASFFAKLRNAGVEHMLVKSAASLSNVPPVLSAPPVQPLPSVLPASTGIMSLPRQLPAAQAVQMMNQHLGFAHDWGGKSTHFRIDGAGRVYPCSPQEMKEALASRSIVAADGTRKPAYPIWNSSPDRCEVAEVRFDPAGSVTTGSGQPILNLWRGFARVPQPGSWELMGKHLFAVVCSGNTHHLHYLLAWMAHLVQRPWEAPGVVIVLRSQREGTGKTTVLGWLSAMLGIHALMLSDPTQLLGRFNTHLETISFVGLNELGWAGNRDAAAKLKSIITDPTITIERKHGGVYSVPNILHIMATSNNDWVVPAGDGARRFLVLDVNPARASDRAYFDALYHEAENGGIEALMDCLQRFKLDRVNLRAVPVTDALREQQERSLSLQAQWAIDVADRAGNIGVAGAIIFGHTVDTRALYEDYLTFATNRRVKRPLDSGPFGKWLTKVGLEDDRTSSARQRILPTADEFAKLVRKSAGVHQ